MDKKFQVDSLFDAHPLHQKKKAKNSSLYQILTKRSQRKCLDRKTCKTNVVVTEC